MPRSSHRKPWIASARSLLILCAVLLIPGPIVAQVVEMGIEVSSAPPLEVLAMEDGAKVLVASAGVVVQLDVLARLSNGSTQNVTSDPGTAYTSLAPDVVTVDQDGRLLFAQPGSGASAIALILVERNSSSKVIAFNVPAE